MKFKVIDTKTHKEPTHRVIHNIAKKGGLIIDIVSELPSAQPEIVMCKDCKHYINHNCYEGNHINIGLFVHDNNYCVWAERRSNG